MSNREKFKFPTVQPLTALHELEYGDFVDLMDIQDVTMAAKFAEIKTMVEAVFSRGAVSVNHVRE